MSIFARTIKQKEALVALYRSRVYLEDLTPDVIRGLGAKGVIFDHDGVLSPSRAPQPDEVGLKKLSEAIEEFGVENVFVLSNSVSRKEVRSAYFREKLPETPYLLARRKPDPEGLIKASSLSGIEHGGLAMIDDSLLTGGLMAIEQGAIPLYAIRKNIEESFFPKMVRLTTTLPQVAIVALLAIFTPKSFSD